MHAGETGGSGQHAPELTLRIVRGLNYLMGSNSGLRAMIGGAVEVFLQTDPAIPAHTSANRGGVTLHAMGGVDPFRGDMYIEDGVAYLDDHDTKEIVSLPLKPGTLEVDSSRIERWDEETKQNIFKLTGLLLRVHFSVDRTDNP